jgi:hypothetical protein
MTTTAKTAVMEIGDAAGEVWRYLDRHGASSLAQIRKGVPRPAEMVAMSLGWLAREEKLRIEQKGRVKKFSLVR